MPSPARPLFRALRWPLAAAVVIALCLQRWGGDLLIACDPAPGHVDAAIVLQGSIAAEKVRIARAINLLQRGVADRALLNVPKESYWGQSIPPVARSYLERNYGSDLASRVDFCETSWEGGELHYAGGPGGQPLHPGTQLAVDRDRDLDLSHTPSGNDLEKDDQA